MKVKLFAAAVLAAILLVNLSACGKTQSTNSSDKSDSAVQTDQDNESKTASLNADETTKDEAWKEEFKNRLFEEYGVIPERYEDLGNGIYQVYVEVGGEVVPFVTVDSATGDYHG